MLARLAVAIAAGYLLGCLCGGYYLVRWGAKADIRELHTGNAGATNAGRVLGAKGYLATLFWDAAKGGMAAALGGWLGDGEAFFAAAALLGAILGHVHPAQLRFHGGKGLATAWGGAWVIDWRLAAIMIVLAVALRQALPGRDAAGWLILALFPLMAFWLHGPCAETLLALAMATLMLANYGAERGRRLPDAPANSQAPE
ncbi:MAG: glycerol-3-phosphate acyltransferase [Planctomycetes bacterium]|nr:glycerol-3-phosphate acyltransferase [Planctomycetota bacterium]